MNPHEFFFQNVTAQQPQQLADPEWFQHNLVALEVANNWPFVCELMRKKKEGQLQQVDEMEQLWHNFLVGNNIDIESYKNNEEFLKANLRAVPN
jgi:hypothetical protein